MKHVFSLIMVTLLLAGLVGAQAGAAQPRAFSASEEESTASMTTILKVNDLDLRRAVAYCTNKAGLIRSVYPTLTDSQVNALVRDSFIPAGHWAYDASSYQYPYEPDTGRALLESAGWVVGDNGIRQNADGIRLALKLSTTNAAFRQTWAAAFEQQMADCGIQVVRLHAPAAWFFGDTTGISRRDFELGAFAWVSEMDPGGTALYACDQIPSVANNWTGQNYTGWCNPTASDAIIAANSTLIRADRAVEFATVQEEFGKDVPSLPLFERNQVFAHSNELTGFNPVKGEQYYSHNAHQWARSGQSTLYWGMSQEPASLFGLVEGSWVAQLILAAVEGLAYTTPNYTPQPLLQSPLATIENGKAVNNTVEVKAGDVVVDANGTVRPLAVGVEVTDASGNRVTFTGTPINMKQLTVNYTFLNNLKWNDGSLVVQEDFQLGYETTCSIGNFQCQYVKTYAANAHGYDIAWLPGIQDPLYYLAPFGFYPAHRPINHPSYSTLGELPAAEWDTQYEVTNIPWGAGPYYVSEWVHGNHIMLTRNNHYALGLPATQNIYVFLTNNPEGLIISGTIDLVGPDSLAGISSTLAAATNVTNLSLASGTWEHIDFNFDLQEKVVNPTQSLSVRRAIAYCTNKTDLVKAGYPMLNQAQASTMTLDSFLPKNHWAYKIPATQYPFNPDLGKTILDAAGWTVGSDGYRYNANGESLALELFSTNSALRLTFLATFELQMKNCGVRLLRMHTVSHWLFGSRSLGNTTAHLSGIGLRDFELTEFAWVFDDPAGMADIYGCQVIPSAEKAWQGQNNIGWCNQKVDAALQEAAKPASNAVRTPYYWSAADEFAKDMPSLPLYARPNHFAYKNTLQHFTPVAGEDSYTYNIYQWSNGAPTINWAMTSEPGSLSPLFFSGMPGEQVTRAGLFGLPATSLNYNPQPLLQNGFATLENGLAQNSTVTVDDGDTVMNAGGVVITLAPGAFLHDATGALVTFTGDPIQMKQLVVPYTFRDTLKWQNGSLVSQADFQLGYDATCDPTTGTTDELWQVCLRTKTFTANPHGYTVTWVPGYQDQRYFVAPFPYFPASRMIGSTPLASVPHDQWQSLPEINDLPWSAGPYYVAEWVHGDHLTLSSNPYFTLGVPATGSIRINFIAADALDAAMATNDLVGYDSLAGFTSAMLSNTNLTKLALPSRTWEHIDFNLGFEQPYTEVVAAPPSGSTVVDMTTTLGEVSVALQGVTTGGSLTVTLDPVIEEDEPSFKTILWPAISVTTGGGLDFTSLTITLPYNESDVLQAGLLSESSLRLYHFDGTAWVDVTTNVDTVNNTISGVVTSLSPFLIGGNTPVKTYLPITLK